jgi:alpha-acetolactate decarboxylase
MKHRASWALVDGNGEIIFLNGQAEVYENQREAISANKDQGDEYTVVACTLMWKEPEKEEADLVSA